MQMAPFVEFIVDFICYALGSYVLTCAVLLWAGIVPVDFICYALGSYVLTCAVLLWAGIVPSPYDRLCGRTRLWKTFRDRVNQEADE